MILQALALAGLLAQGSSVQAAESTGYHVTGFIAIGGDQDWDYIKADPDHRRLYVSHGSKVEVLDLDSQKPVGSILDTKGVHGIALAPEAGLGYTSNGDENTSSRFELASLKVLGKTKVGGGDPDGIIYDPATKRILTHNGDGKSVTAIESATGEVAGTVDLGGGPEYGVADGQGHEFVNLEHEGKLVKLDTRKLKVLKSYPMHAEGLCSMAWDGKDRLFIGCRDHQFLVVNAKNGKVVFKGSLADHVDASVFDPESGNIYNSCGEGVISVFHQDSADSYRKLEDIRTLEGAKTMAYDPKTHSMFLPCAKDNQYGVLVVSR
jgi:DNA-binding beta-propeller fold protein YncE